MSKHLIVECFGDEIEKQLETEYKEGYDLITCTLIQPKIILTMYGPTHIHHDNKFLLIFKRTHFSSRP